MSEIEEVDFSELKPCPECGAEWAEVYDDMPVEDGEDEFGDGEAEGEEEGGLQMVHADDCPLLDPIGKLTEVIDEDVFL